MLTILALFNERLRTDREAFIAENGLPEHLTRHAIGRNADGKIGHKLDKVNGPERDGLTELLDVAVFSEANEPAMLVSMQTPTGNLGEINDDELSDIAIGLEGYYANARDVKFSALGDPELDKDTAIIFIDTDQDGYKTSFEVSAKLQGYTIDGVMSLVYADGNAILLPTEKLLANLRDDTKAIDDGATKIEAIGFGVKMARATKITVAGKETEVWAYVQKTDGDTKPKIFFLDKQTLEMVAMQEFDGDYVTPSHDGKNLVFISRTVDTGDNAVETYTVTRQSTAGFIADQIASQ